jgi:predicted RND superfamily exporter protein
MKRLTELIFRHRAPVIIVFVAITLFFGYWIKDIRVNSDAITYLPATDPAVRLFNHLGEKFKQNDVVLIAVESEDVFTPRTLQDVDSLTRAFQGVDGVSSVISLADMMDIRKAADGGIEIGRLFEPGSPPTSPQPIQALRTIVMGSSRYRGGIVSNDGRTTLIVCQISSGARTGAIVARIQSAAAACNVAEKLHFGGNPLLMTELSAIILHDLKVLIPIVSVLIILTLFAAFGTIRGVLIPLGSVLMSTVWVLGLFGLLKVPLTMVSDIIPALLVALGTAPCIHILSKFDEDVTRYGSSGPESVTAFREVGIRVVLAALTIVLGFSSFIMGSYLTTIRDFGIFSSIGILFSLLISIFFVPAVISSITVRPRRTAGARNRLVSRFMTRWADFVVRRRKAILVAAGVVLLFGIAGIPFIQRESEFTTFLDANNPVRRTDGLLQREFGGSRPLQIDFKGDLSNPRVLQEMMRMETFLTREHLASNPLSIADLIAEMNELADNQKTIPDDPAKVANLMFLLEGQDMVSGLIDDAKSEGQIQAMVGIMGSAQLEHLVSSLDGYVRGIDSRLVKVSYTGMPVISWHLDRSVLQSQAESLGIALVFIFLLLAFKLRSWRAGVLGLAPIVLAIVLMFGLMGITGIPINVATVLVGAIALGIGIDYSIHFSVRFSTYYRGPASAADAIRKTIQTTGLAIVINVLAVTTGFIALLFANLIPLRQFGILTAIVMVGSGTGALTLLPALILRAPALFMGGGRHAHARHDLKEERHETLQAFHPHPVPGRRGFPDAGAGHGPDAGANPRQN